MDSTESCGLQSCFPASHKKLLLCPCQVEAQFQVILPIFVLFVLMSDSSVLSDINLLTVSMLYLFSWTAPFWIWIPHSVHLQDMSSSSAGAEPTWYLKHQHWEKSLSVLLKCFLLFPFLHCVVSQLFSTADLEMSCFIHGKKEKQKWLSQLAEFWFLLITEEKAVFALFERE